MSVSSSAIYTISSDSVLDAETFAPGDKLWVRHDSEVGIDDWLDAATFPRNGSGLMRRRPLSNDHVRSLALGADAFMLGFDLRVLFGNPIYSTPELRCRRATPELLWR